MLGCVVLDSGSAPAPADGLRMSPRCLRPRSCLWSADGGRLSGLSRAAFFSDDGAARWEEDVQPISEWWVFVVFFFNENHHQVSLLDGESCRCSTQSLDLNLNSALRHVYVLTGNEITVKLRV